MFTQSRLVMHVKLHEPPYRNTGQTKSLNPRPNKLPTNINQNTTSKWVLPQCAKEGFLSSKSKCSHRKSRLVMHVKLIEPPCRNSKMANKPESQIKQITNINQNTTSKWVWPQCAKEGFLSSKSKCSHRKSRLVMHVKLNAFARR